MRRDHAPPARAKATNLGIITIQIHRQLESRRRNSARQIQVFLEGKLLREIWKFTVDLDSTAPVPLSNRREFRNGRPSLRPNQFGIHQRKKSSPAERRRRQSAISRAGVEPDRPEFVVMRLAHFHFRHPIKDFARIEIAEDSLFELEEKRRMERIAQVQQRVRAGQSIE